MMNRRAFLKTIAAGAVSAVVPLPVPMYAIEMWAGGFPTPAEPFRIVGTVTAYFENTALYEKVLKGNQVFVRWAEDVVIRKPQDQDQQP